MSSPSFSTLEFSSDTYRGLPSKERPKGERYNLAEKDGCYYLRRLRDGHIIHASSNWENNLKKEK